MRRKRAIASESVGTETVEMKQEKSSVLDKKCTKCGNLPRMLGLQTTIINACGKCRNLADSMARIRERERLRGKPEVQGGTLCRKKDRAPTNNPY